MTQGVNRIMHKPENGCETCDKLWAELCHWKQREAQAQGKIVELLNERR